jgi:hypothetical protein
LALSPRGHTLPSVIPWHPATIWRSHCARKALSRNPRRGSNTHFMPRVTRWARRSEIFRLQSAAPTAPDNYGVAPHFQSASRPVKADAARWDAISFCVHCNLPADPAGPRSVILRTSVRCVARALLGASTACFHFGSR